MLLNIDTVLGKKISRYITVTIFSHTPTWLTVPLQESRGTYDGWETHKQRERLFSLVYKGSNIIMREILVCMISSGITRWSLRLISVVVLVFCQTVLTTTRWSQPYSVHNRRHLNTSQILFQIICTDFNSKLPLFFLPVTRDLCPFLSFVQHFVRYFFCKPFI